MEGFDDITPTYSSGHVAVDVAGNLVVWNLENEILKVIETGELLALNQTFGFCNVYVVCVESERKTLWKELANNMNSFSILWVIGDIPLQGMPFTWMNSGENAAWARLDNFLISLSFIQNFPYLKQWGLPRSLSDHNPIVLSDIKDDWGPRPFRFFNALLEDIYIMKDVMVGWKESAVFGSKSAILAAKIRGRKGE
ncbi:hypothetical protein Ddye_017639 [Dipteronia dyeriana]|uniref:Endonuclease/exonuclease/phosphatase domain-containing protein n=1 Tax=Dipteronia dyeriana TaxID=168575 RepID=A0AAD9U923_9ROSI|nr:hypothetical protein Ddye_017639 [Dipteronia dyeriana]